MAHKQAPRLFTAAHLGWSGMVDEAGRELTHAHVMEAVHNILGAPLVKLIQHLGPDHADVQEALHARIRGVWHIDRYDAPIEHYIAKLMGIKEEDVPSAIVPASIHAQALAELKRNHRSDSSEFEEEFDNLFTTNGVNFLWTVAVSGLGAANSAGSAAAATAAFNATQARIGVGDSTTAVTAGDSNLNAATNKEWLVVSGAPTVSTNQIQFTSSFGTSDANFSWQEFAVDNCGGSNAPNTGRSGGTMLDHVLSNQGTKASGQTWQPTMTLTIS